MSVYFAQQKCYKNTTFAKFLHGRHYSKSTHLYQNNWHFLPTIHIISQKSSTFPPVFLRKSCRNPVPFHQFSLGKADQNNLFWSGNHVEKFNFSLGKLMEKYWISATFLGDFRNFVSCFLVNICRFYWFLSCRKIAKMAILQHFCFAKYANKRHFYVGKCR